MVDLNKLRTLYNCLRTPASVDLSIHCCQSGMFNGDSDATVALRRWLDVAVERLSGFSPPVASSISSAAQRSPAADYR